MIYLIALIIINNILFKIFGFNGDFIISVLFACNELLLLLIIKELFEIVFTKIKYKKIVYDDLDKFLYFREILKNYSISELGIIYNKRININTLISLEIISLIKKGSIEINNDDIKILDKENLNYTQKCILDSFKFVGSSELKKIFKNRIKNNLIKKQIFNKLNNEIDYKIIYFIVLIFLFAYAKALETQEIFIFITVMISFLICFFEIFLLIVILSQYSIKIRTKKGQEVYLKLVGLKNYLKEFGKFQEKQLQEIYLWDEYILYAVILNVCKKNKKESLDLFEQISEKIINKSIKIIDYNN